MLRTPRKVDNTMVHEAMGDITIKSPNDADNSEEKGLEQEQQSTVADAMAKTQTKLI